VGLITHPHTSHNQSNWGITVLKLERVKWLSEIQTELNLTTTNDG